MFHRKTNLEELLKLLHSPKIQEAASEDLQHSNKRRRSARILRGSGNGLVKILPTLKKRKITETKFRSPANSVDLNEPLKNFHPLRVQEQRARSNTDFLLHCSVENKHRSISDRRVSQLVKYK